MSIKKQTIWNMMPLVVSAAISFFTMPMFFRFLGDEMSAIFLSVTLISSMFSFADLGLGVAVGRYISIALGKNDQAAVRVYWGTGNMIVLPFLSLAALGFMGILFWAGPKWFALIPASQINLFRACFLVNGLGLFFAYYGSFWLTISQSYLDFKFIGLLRAIVTPLQILPTVALAYYTQNPFYVLAWNTLVGGVQLFVLIWHARHNYALGLCLNYASLACAREMAGYTAKMFLGLVSTSIFGPMDRTILVRLVSMPEFVAYGMGFKIATQLQSLSVAVMGPVLHNSARTADGDPSAAAKIYNDTFAFMFEWYLLAGLWLGVWHPVLLQLYLGTSKAAAVGPLLTPLVAACCLSAISNISGAQLASLNRMGVVVGFSVAAGLLTIAAIWTGWHLAGVTGGAYGYFFSRLALVAQDLYTIRLIKAGGWLDPGTWRKTAAQCLVAAGFALAYLVLASRASYWLLIPAVAHGTLVSAWLLRQPLQKLIAFKKLSGKYS